MELIRGQLQLTRTLPNCVLTLGNFDGFHQGHQQLINQLRQEGKRLKCPTAVITFEPQPREFFNSTIITPRLMRFQEKWQILEEQGIDYLVCLRFDVLLSQYPAEAFVQNILIKQLGMKSIVIGDDFAFGLKRQGDVKLLRKLGEQAQFDTIAMPSFTIMQKRVSSTWVRQALQDNNLKLAQKLLGHPYFLYGKIIHGDARGREWGFPTANISLNDKPVCVSGIFAVQVSGLDHKPWPGVASVGIRPMFSNRGALLEVHLLDFNQSIYGKRIKVEFLDKLRDEKKFDSTAALIAQIEQDVQETRWRLKLC